ncbi:MAG: Unknown protein, partial [uncultured Aureispira sp.]
MTLLFGKTVCDYSASSQSYIRLHYQRAKVRLFKEFSGQKMPYFSVNFLSIYLYSSHKRINVIMNNYKISDQPLAKKIKTSLNSAKYLIIAIISLGFTLSSIIGVEYNCEGSEMFPTYYGSPFIFKQESLGSSMQYYYSISGLFLNLLVWNIVILVVRHGLLSLIQLKLNPNPIKKLYKIFVGFLLVFSFLNISIAYIGLGEGFREGLNYWHWNLDTIAKDWGMVCEGKWYILFWKEK